MKRRPAPWKKQTPHTKLRLQPLVPTHAAPGRGQTARVRDIPTRAVGPSAIRSGRGGRRTGGGAQRTGADSGWLRCAGAWPRAARAAGRSRRPRDSRLLAVHLRADARLFEPGLVTVPVAMSRFKVSKFRHTEARPPRREVSPARRPRTPFPFPASNLLPLRIPLRDPRRSRGAPCRPGTGVRAARSPPGRQCPPLPRRPPAAR